MPQQKLLQRISKGAGQIVFVYLCAKVDSVLGIIEAIDVAGERFDLSESTDGPPLVWQVGPYQQGTWRDGAVQVFNVADIQNAEGKRG